jgi:predicted transcriptional regulator
VNNNTKFQHFYVAPNEIFDFDKSDLSVYAKIVYLYICRCENNSTAFPSFNKIAAKCSISRSSAQRAVNDLVEAGLIIKESGVHKGNFRDNTSNTYVTVDPVNFIKTDQQKENGIVSHNMGVVTEDIGVVSGGINKRTINIGKLIGNMQRGTDNLQKSGMSYLWQGLCGF